MRILTAAVSALAYMGVVVAGTAAPVESHPAVQAVQKKPAYAKYQRQAHNTTNKHREAHGLRELRRTDCVQRFAVRQAKRMAKQEEMFHQDLGPILEACGLNAVGENVAYGYPTGRSVVNDGWMNSPGHRANILNPDFRLMGIGARKGDNGRWYVAQVFGRKA
ncbi:CAP domain-containing protein [Nocardioides dilutus]